MHTLKHLLKMLDLFLLILNALSKTLSWNFLFTTKDNLLIEIHEHSVQCQKMLLGQKFLKQKTQFFSRQELTNNVCSTDLNLLIADCVINYGLIMPH